MALRIPLALVAALLPASLATSTFTEIVPATTLDNTERGAFTSDGRFFVIGVRPADAEAGKGTLAEVVRNGETGYALQDFVIGTLEGTADGSVGGQPVGDSCVFSGMAAHGTVLYAGCYAPDGRAALIALDTEKRSVRAGYFTACNLEPASSTCAYSSIYPNGMAVDADGRIYVSNTLAHINVIDGNLTVRDQGSSTLTQVTVNLEASDATHLAFRHKPWFSADILTESFVPNGVQIEGDQLYYAAGPNINQLAIRPDGTAGEVSAYFRGAALTYIDDFAVSGGELALACTIAPSIVGVQPLPLGGQPQVTDAYLLSLEKIPSSVTKVPEGSSLFGNAKLVITCYFGGGLYTL